MDYPNVFTFSSYIEFMKARIAAEKENWGLVTRLAKASQCQRPYLSRVLAQRAHLTPAQAYGIGQFFKLESDELNFFLGLLEIERAGSAEYRNYWIQKNSDLKLRNENLSKVVERDLASGDEKDLLYYSAWYWSAIHILVSIPEYQTEKTIAEKLSISVALVRMVLHTLAQWGWVRQDGHHWKFVKQDRHISKDSPLAVFHHANWRQQAMANAQQRDPKSVHFTVVQSLSRGDYERIKALILDSIRQASEIARPSQEEKLMCFTCDFFEP